MSSTPASATEQCHTSPLLAAAGSTEYAEQQLQLCGPFVGVWLYVLLCTLQHLEEASEPLSPGRDCTSPLLAAAILHRMMQLLYFLGCVGLHECKSSRAVVGVFDVAALCGSCCVAALCCATWSGVYVCRCFIAMLGLAGSVCSKQTSGRHQLLAFPH